MEGGALRFNTVKLHSELLQPWEDCLGGGRWCIDQKNKRLVLEGSSYDFGTPRWRQLIKDNIGLVLPKAYKGLEIIYIYDDGYELNLSRLLNCRYEDASNTSPAETCNPH